MLLTATIDAKTIGSKELFSGLTLNIQQGEKIAIIGRNGVGKTTLFHLLAGDDHDYSGSIQMRRGTSVVMTAQEHTEHVTVTCLDYILENLPEYRRLHQIIDAATTTMGSDINLITRYTDALGRFGELGYFTIESKVLAALDRYQIDEGKARDSLGKLSGGQKRFVELVKVTAANADLALIDEPTNHMDYIAKAAFIDWLAAAAGTVIVITHDRDVLKTVDRIIEIKDQKAVNFPGNYDAYLKQNSLTTVTQIGQYEVAQRTIDNLKKQIQYARSKKSSWGGTADKKNPFVVMEERLTKQLKTLEQTVGKPSFWIDQDSVEQLENKVVESYDKYKDRNIRISGTTTAQLSRQPLVQLKQLSLGYNKPLFDDLSFVLAPGERLQIRGRNGAGKTTLIQVIRQALGDATTRATVYSGTIEFDQKLRLGIYEQEPDPKYLKMSLGNAIADVFRSHDVSVNEQKIRQTLADYLFDPVLDYKIPLKSLSGGQRARFQIISMLCNQPNLLILDEPTNHLDLPSIEELEKALGNYEGAIIFVSHDSYFVDKLEGEVIQIGQR